MWPYKYAYNILLVTLILNIYIWVCGRSSILFSGKSSNFGCCFFNTERGAHDIPLVTLILNVWVFGSNFNCSSMNRGHTGRQTNRQTVHTL